MVGSLDAIASLSTGVPIILLASACWDSVVPLNVHHIAKRFSVRGNSILFVESTGLRAPVITCSRDLRRVLRRLRDWRRGVRRVDDRLWVLSPLALPWNLPKPLRTASMRWVASAVARAAKSLKMDRPILWSFLPTYLAVAQRLPHRLFVYHCVDHYAANPGVDGPWIESLERRTLDRSDLVIATSPVLADRLARRRPSVQLLPNVADVDLFSRAVTEDLPEPECLHGVPRPRLVYLGNLAAYRIDLELLLYLAQRNPNAHLLLIGVIGHGDTHAMPSSLKRLLACKNVHALGVKPREALPAYLRHCDAGLIPFLDNEHTHGSLPLKLWEYVAAGLPVVATDLPNFRELTHLGIVRTASGAGAFNDALQEALSDSSDSRHRRLQIARNHDWKQRIDELAAILGTALGKA
ncbi:MAG: glycosyltransferase [Planctomycetes bacterium]|nr:glycosyltransferase [Planctomycetota bacterium]